MTRNWFATALLALVPALAIAQDKGGTAPPQKAPDENKPFVVGSVVDPTLSFVDVEGKAHTLKEYLGKPILIDFWSIECPVSKGYEARLKALATEYAKKGVVFIAVDSNKGEVGGADGIAKIVEYVKKESIPYTVLLDKGNVVADRFAAATTPHIFILDDKGKVKYMGAVDDDPQGGKDAKAVKHYAKDALEAVLAGKDPATKESKPVGCSIKRVAAKG